MISPAEFEGLVAEALDGLPEEFAGLLRNIVVVVEEEPSPEDLEETGEGDEGGELLGIYRGIPQTERSWEHSGVLPDQIAIFRGPILRCCRSRREAMEEIRDTVIHELGHYFGLDDEEMEY